MCLIMHADGAGTKSSLAMHIGKKQMISQFGRYFSRLFGMNIDDLICVGATKNIVVSSTIGEQKINTWYGFKRNY